MIFCGYPVFFLCILDDFIIVILLRTSETMQFVFLIDRVLP